VCGHLYFKICKEKGVKFDNEHCYKDVPKSVETSPEVTVTILRNQQVKIETTLNNKPDIINRDNEKGTRMLINAAHSGDGNVFKKETEKILKYEVLTTSQVQFKNNGETSNGRDEWNPLKIFHKISQQHPGKAQNQVTTEHSHIGHCTPYWALHTILGTAHHIGHCTPYWALHTYCGKH
jgi:hypothetical protein